MPRRVGQDLRHKGNVIIVRVRKTNNVWYGWLNHGPQIKHPFQLLQDKGSSISCSTPSFECDGAAVAMKIERRGGYFHCHDGSAECVKKEPPNENGLQKSKD